MDRRWRSALFASGADAQGDDGDKEPEGTEGRVSGDRGQTARRRGGRGGDGRTGEYGLSTADDHGPLGADGAPASNRHDELDGSGEQGPEAEHEQGRPDGGEDGDDHSGGGGDAETHVDGTDAVRGAGAGQATLEERGDGVPQGVDDEQHGRDHRGTVRRYERGGGREDERHPDQGEGDPDQIERSQPGGRRRGRGRRCRSHGGLSHRVSRCDRDGVRRSPR